MRSSEHLLGIIDDILDLAKAEAGRAKIDDEDVDMRQVTAVCLRIIRERAPAASVLQLMIAGLYWGGWAQTT